MQRCTGKQQEKARIYAGVLWVKLQTFHGIYLATSVYYCCVLGIEVILVSCSDDNIMRSD